MNSVQKQIIQLVRNTVNTYSSTPIPNIDEICDGLGLEIREDTITDGRDGMIVDKTNIIINSKIRYEERKRFTIFHEIMHYLIDNDDDLISILNAYTLYKDGEYDRQLEIFANIGAAEFLMPSEELRKLYEEKDFNVELILYAAKLFKSSTIAATIQLAQVAPNECITAICEFTQDKTTLMQSQIITQKEKSLKRKLHVSYAASSPNVKYMLAKNTVIPGDHLIQDAFLQDVPVEGKSYVPFRSGKKMPCYCEALADGDRIYALFHLTPPPNPDQLSLI